MIGSEPEFSVAQAVAVLNQTLEMVYPSMRIVGEVSSFKVSKGKWVYFDIKDDEAKLRCFTTVYQLPMPIEDGMQVVIEAEPRIHPQFGFTLTVRTIQLVGEGTIKKAADLLFKKLAVEGLFEPERKRAIVRIPQSIALITSAESAAYADFTKIVRSRWPLLTVDVYDTQVQGDSAVEQIVSAIQAVNQQSVSYDVLVLIRGGGSADDLQAFSAEHVVRAIAGSRTPTCVAIGHETDESLAELASDMRASTPSNAAELLVPDKQEEATQLTLLKKSLVEQYEHARQVACKEIQDASLILHNRLSASIDQQTALLESQRSLLRSFHPERVLERGYSIVRKGTELLTSHTQLRAHDELVIMTKEELVLVQFESRKKRNSTS